MKIKNIYADFTPNGGLPPVIKIEVEDYPNVRDRVYSMYDRDHGHFFVCHGENGFRSFMYDSIDRDSGNSMDVPIFDGTTFYAMSVWSSRAAVLNHEGLGPIVPCTYVNLRDPLPYPGEGIDLHVLMDWMSKNETNFELVHRAHNFIAIPKKD